MKIRVFVLLFLLVISFFLADFLRDNLQVNQITANTLNTKATALFFGIAVRIDLDPPSITIDDPETTGSYTTATNIPLNFIVYDTPAGVDKIYYNIDDSSNITITENITFTSSLGTHTLKLFANDTKGNINFTSVNFTVTSPSAVGSSGSGGAGGGGGGGGKSFQEITPIYSIAIDKEIIKMRVKQGETVLDNFTLKNTGNVKMGLKLFIQGLSKFLMLNKEDVIINPGESDEVKTIATASETEKAEVYTGKILISSDKINEVILTIIEVIEKKALFDVKVDLIKDQETTEQGKVINPQIMIYNLGDLKPVDVELFYSLRDFDGKDIIYHEETFAVGEQKLFTGKIKIPSDLKEGFYLIYTKVTYNNQTAVSSFPFKVIQKERLSTWILAIILIIIVIYLYIVYIRNNKTIRKLFK